MVATTVTESLLLDEIVSGVAFDEVNTSLYQLANLFTIREMTGRQEKLASYSDLDNWQLVGEGVASPEDKPTAQFSKIYTPGIWKKKVPMTRELVRDEGWGYAEKVGSMFGGSFARTWETYAAAVFNGAFTTTTTEDSLSLCNTAHVNVSGGNSQSNSLTNSLGLTGLKNTRQAGRDFKDYNGQLMAFLKHSLLLVPNELEFDAVEISLSTERPDTASRAANQYAGIPVIVWDFLTDANAWFMIDVQRAAQHLFWFVRDALEIWGSGDLDTGQRQVGGYARSAHGAQDWRWVIGNNPS